jgi:capsular exopolysaccharide synthesis family protein
LKHLYTVCSISRVEEDPDVDLREYLRVARKRWRLLAGAVILALMVAGLITIRTPPQYATSVTFFINTPNSGVTDAYQGGLFSQQRVKSYANLLTSDRLATAIAREAPVGLGPDEVRQRIEAVPVQETVLLQATVTDRSKDRSLRIAEELAKQFKVLVELLETPPQKTTSAVKVEIVAGPRLDETPVSPRPVRNLALAALLGLILGAGVALLRELLDTTVKTSEGLQQIAGAPVLAGVPYDANAGSDPLLVGAGGRTARAEALRQLRTNLQFVDVDRPVRTLVVTSAVPGEGKSSTACNLAILFAETGARVLVIDADLRRPRLASYLGLEGAVGLTTVLAGQAQVDDVVQRWGAGLWVLPSGALPPNPSELLGSQHMAELLDAFRETYDMVIVDCPPLLPVTDGAVLAARADGALMMARARKTTSSQVTAAVQALRSVDARLLGCVFNMVQADAPDAYYTYYGYGSRPSGGRHGRQSADPARMDSSLEELMGAGSTEPAAAGSEAEQPIKSAR